MRRMIMYMMQVAVVVAIVGLNGCILFLGDAEKKENVSIEAGKRLKTFLKEVRE